MESNLPVVQRLTLRSIHDLREAPWNPQDHTPEHVERLRASIHRFGFIAPLVVRATDGLVVGGHGRLRAARSLWDEGYAFSGPEGDCLPCMEGAWSEPQVKWLNLALNHVQQELDQDRLKQVLKRLSATWTLGDLTVGGFTEKRLEAILRDRPPRSPRRARDIGRSHKTRNRKVMLTVAPNVAAEWEAVREQYGSDDEVLTTALERAEPGGSP